MAIDFKLPDLGENIESGDIVNVLVKEGEEIQADQSVLEIETGKAVVDLPCPHAGKITKIHVKKGSKVKVGDPLLSIDAVASEKKEAPKQKKSQPAEPKAASSAKTPPPAKAEPGGDAAHEKTLEAEPQQKKKVDRSARSSDGADDRTPHSGNDKPASTAKKPTTSTRRTPPAGPATRRLARELGVDLNRLSGSGAGGRITEEDIKAAVRQESTAGSKKTSIAREAPLPEGTQDHDQWGSIRRQQMTGIRKAIAASMLKSATTVPQLTNFDDADITELERIRKGGLTDYVDSSVKLTMMSFVMKAVAQSLRLHPMLNSSIDMEADEIIYKQYVNIGVAVDTERGLVVPVVRDVDQMSIPRIAQALQTVAERSRSSQLSLDDMRGSTFTISNMGSIGGTYSTPIINLPNVAILLVGKSRRMPVVVEDRIEPRLMMPLSLTYDHRVVDGATAGRFLNEMINYLSVPGRLLLAP